MLQIRRRAESSTRLTRQIMQLVKYATSRPGANARKRFGRDIKDLNVLRRETQFTQFVPNTFGKIKLTAGGAELC